MIGQGQVYDPSWTSENPFWDWVGAFGKGSFSGEAAKLMDEERTPGTAGEPFASGSEKPS